MCVNILYNSGWSYPKLAGHQINLMLLLLEDMERYIHNNSNMTIHCHRHLYAKALSHAKKFNPVIVVSLPTVVDFVHFERKQNFSHPLFNNTKELFENVVLARPSQIFANTIQKQLIMCGCTNNVRDPDYKWTIMCVAVCLSKKTPTIRNGHVTVTIEQEI